MDKSANSLKVQYLYGKLVCRCDRYKQERDMSYPGRSVFAFNKYLTQEGNDELAVSRRDDVNGTEVSRGRSRLVEKLKVQTRNEEWRLEFR